MNATQLIRYYVIAKRTGATVIGPKAVTDFLRWRSRLPREKLVTVQPFETRAVPGFKLTTFHWKHRDINLAKALSKAVFHGNATQLSWAWSSATSAPFYSPYTGYHVELASGLTCAVRKRLPNAAVIIAAPGTTVDADTGALLEQRSSAALVQ